MFKKSLIVMLAFVIAFAFVAPLRAYGSPANPPPNPYELIVDTIPGGGPVTLDPASCYDTASAELIFNIYETLIFFDGERYDVFRARLATQAWIVSPGATVEGVTITAPPYTNYSIVFKIRQGIKFQTWCRSDLSPIPTWAEYTLTAEDVEYTFERWMVHDYIGGPQWMIFEPLLDCFGADTEHPVEFGQKIDAAVQRSGDLVWLNIANPGLTPKTPSQTFVIPMFEADGSMRGTFWSDVATKPLGYPLRILLQVIAQSWASIISKQWILNYVIPNGPDMNEDVPGDQVDWDGNWGDYTGWVAYCGWEYSPIDKIPQGAAHPGVACGTGPFILDRYDPTTEWSVVRNPDYWGGWPAQTPSPPYPPITSSGIKPAGYVNRLTVRQRATATRIAELRDGLCDFAAIPRAYAPQLHVDNNRNGPTLPGIRLNYPIPALQVDSFHFTFDIEPRPDNKYGKINDYNVLSEDGIPRNFFSDIHVRKAFVHLLNFTLVIMDQLLGEAYQPHTCAPDGLPYVNLAQARYGPTPDFTKAKQEFDQAFGGNLKNVGFTIKITYNSGNTIRQAYCENLASLINKLGQDYYGGKFHAEAMPVAWSEYIPDMDLHFLPCFGIGWLADYADIHNFMHPYLHSEGAFAHAQRYHNAEADELIAQGARAPDGPARQAIYYRLQEIYYNDVPSVAIFVPVGRGYMRIWVQGHYYNPLYPGLYAYDHWKWEYLRGNVNYDNKVSMDDIVAILDAYGSYAGKLGMPVFHPRWNFHCDVDGNPYDTWRDRKIDMYDVTAALDNFGKSDQTWVPPP